MPTTEPQLDITALSQGAILHTEATPVEIVQAAASEGQARKLPRFTMLAYTGVAMLTNAGRVVVDLAGMTTVPSSTAILHLHSFDRVVGQSSDVRIEGEPPQLHIDGKFTSRGQYANEIIENAGEGFNWQASVGVRIERVEFLETGKTANVNGREVVGPLGIIRAGRLYEVSFVPVGADTATSAKVTAAGGTPRQEGNMDSFDKWMKDRGVQASSLTDEQRAAWRKDYDKLNASAGDDPPPTSPQPKKITAGSIEDTLAKAEAEAARQSSINEIVAEHLSENPQDVSVVRPLAEAALASKQSVDEFRLKVMRLTSTHPGAGVGARSAPPEQSSRILEAALAQSVSLATLEKDYDERTLQAAEDQFGGTMGLKDLIHAHARQNGWTGFKIDNDLESAVRAAFSTNDLPTILSNVANKSLMAGFMHVERVWEAFARQANNKDFKETTRVRLNADMTFKKLPPTGELEHGKLSEESFNNQVDTYGVTFSLDRRQIVNDDLNAFGDLPMQFGIFAGHTLNDVLFAEFLNNASFFTEARGNLLVGATTALGVDSFTKAVTAFRNRKGPNGKRIGMRPKTLLVPTELETDADLLMTSKELRESGGSTSKVRFTENPHRNKAKVVSSAFLSDESLAGSSALAWYLLADPMMLPVIEVAWLNGRRRPVFETAQARFDQLGIQMRAYTDFGVRKQDNYGGVKVKGEA